MASRAQLLAGLRTGGPGSPRMDSGDAHFYQQQGQHSPTQLKASAAPFTPGSGYEALEQHQHHQQLHREKSLEEHMASLQLQQQGGAHLTQQQLAAAQLHNILRQRQQQQQTQGQAHAQHQMDLLRQQQQQAAVAQHQRALLGQIQAEYDRQAQVNALREQMELQQAQQSQQQAYSAAEQRQAAQASIQASLRTRQAQQLYAQMLQQQQQLAGAYGQEEVNAEALQQFQQAQLVQRMHAIQQLQAVAQQQQFALAAQQYAAQTGGAPAEQSPYGSNDSGSRRVSNNSPQLNGGQSRRSPTLNELAENKRSVSSADQASSWRSRTATNGSTSKNSTTTVVDDSASEKSIEMPMSRNSSNTGFAGGVDTPDTSEDDVGADKQQQQQQPAKMAPLHVRKQGAATAAPAAKHTLPSMPAPRPINISAAPRSRNFTAEAKAAMSASGPVLSNQPTRQPRGPPTDFKPVNFQSRISARTRREAMSRLCASPRVASFAGGLVGAQQSAAEPSQGPGGALGFSALGVPAKLQSVA